MNAGQVNHVKADTQGKIHKATLSLPFLVNVMKQFILVTGSILIPLCVSECFGEMTLPGVHLLKAPSTSVYFMVIADVCKQA